MASAYDFHLTNGTLLATIPSLEANGPFSQSTPREVLDIGFNVQSAFIGSITATTLEVTEMVSGVLSSGYYVAGTGITPSTSIISQLPVSFSGHISVTTLTVVSMYAGTLLPGQIVLANGANTTILSQVSGTTGGVGVYDVSVSQTVGTPLAPVTMTIVMGGVGHYTVSTAQTVASETMSASENYFVINDNSLYTNPSLQAGHSIDILNSPYAGTYTVTSSVSVGTNTQVAVSSPIAKSPLNILGVDIATNTWTAEGIENGPCVFYPGSTFTVQGNLYAGVLDSNKTYTVV